jgi:NAD(P)-dependent dehydrogenase (short-subunit alcohol dehydrogenase family)
MKIEGSVFIVTGGASGLGGATAAMIVAEGGSVVVADVNTTAGEAHASALGSAARFVKCDVTTEADGQAAVDAALAIGPLRGLINCAGIAIGQKTVGRDGPHPLDAFQRVIMINLVGSFNMIRLAATAMSRQDPLPSGERGLIVNTASVAAYDGQIGQAAYSASKGGIVGMTLPIARDLSRDGIRVMTIAPGIFETPMLMNMSQELRDSLGKQVPFPSRLGRATEYADLVRSIAGNEMLNGETIRLDGAIRMAPR